MAFGDLFDSPWKILIIAAVVLILFGSKKMPDAARSLGRSMRILKSEVKGMHDDDAADAQGGQQAQPQPQQLTTAAGAPAASVPMAPADGVPAAPAPAPASVPVSAEVQQDTRPA